LAVVGFDNITESAFFCPSLSTVSQDQQLLGETAVHTVVEMIEANQNDLPLDVESRFLTPTLIIRESSGTPN
jgi:DNA-binding LacI/PurR family transcriptional regulator